MGYDMFIEQIPAHLANEKEAVSETEWYKITEEEQLYFRFNMWGMSNMRDHIAQILQWNLEYKDVEDDVASEGFVAGHKLCSNDGWLVTPRECLVIAEYLKDNPHKDDYSQSFMDFCLKGAECGGFRVY